MSIHIHLCSFFEIYIHRMQQYIPWKDTLHTANLHSEEWNWSGGRIFTFYF